MTCILFRSSEPPIILIIVLIFINISSPSPTKSPSSASPEIWLASYDESDYSYENTPAQPQFRSLDQFDNKLISKFNTTEYIVGNSIREVVFTCQAKYPITWAFPHLKQVENLHYFMFETVSSRVSDFSREENPVPRNELFQSSLTIFFTHSENFFSVNVTCEGTEIKMRVYTSSIYIYFTGKHAIENPGTTTQVYVSPSKDKDTQPTFILPCRPATPNVRILLEKQIDNPNIPENSPMKKKWDQVQYPSKHVNFDPKLGFIMDKDSLGKRTMSFGLYRCTAIIGQADEQDDGMDNWPKETGSNQQQYKYINITSINDPNVINTENIHFYSNLSFKGDALVMYSHKTFHMSPIIPLSLNNSLQSYQDNDFVCCSGIDDTRPMIFLNHCLDPFQCKLLKWSLTRKVQLNASLDYDYFTLHSHGEGDPSQCRSVNLIPTQVVICKGENVNFASHLIEVFNANLLPVVSRLLIKGSLGKQDKMHLSTFQAEDSGLDDASRKIFLAIGYPISGRQLVEDNGRYYDRNENLGYSSIKWSIIEKYEAQGRLEELHLNIAEYPRDHFYVGEPLVPYCLGWSLFYSSGGAYVGVTFKNGTTQIISDQSHLDKMEAVS